MAKKKYKEDQDTWSESDNDLQRLVAKKDWSIHQNDFHREIKQGDDVSDLEQKFLDCLKAEGVI